MGGSRGYERWRGGKEHEFGISKVVRAEYHDCKYC